MLLRFLHVDLSGTWRMPARSSTVLFRGTPALADALLLFSYQSLVVFPRQFCVVPMVLVLGSWGSGSRAFVKRFSDETCR